MNPPFLDPWIFDRTGPAFPQDLGAYQTRALKQTLAHAMSNSRFYPTHFKNINLGKIRDIHDISALPFTRPAHIRARPTAFLCRSQNDISRIVTLGTSGTTARPKRIFFTESDLDTTVDFFSSILSHFMESGDTGLIFLPGPSHGSAGDLIRKGMETIGAKGIVHGIITNFEPAARRVLSRPPALIIGMPVQILALGEYLSLTREAPAVPRVILTADHVPDGVAARIEYLFNCRVLVHYGMTETGFGGAIQCPCQEGFHPRLRDLFFEIIHPFTGRVLPHGQWGEIAVTTLNRTGMPLIRYRTGDHSRILDTPCACGSPLPRLDRIRNRQTDPGPGPITMADLDDTLFALPGVTDFRARIDTARTPPVLDIELMAVSPLPRTGIEPAPESPLKSALDSGRLKIGSITTRPFDFKNTYVKKRQILYK